jgi:hypothetical protein
MANNPQQKVFEDPELRLIEGREEQIFGGRQQARQQRKASLMKRGGLLITFASGHNLCEGPSGASSLPPPSVGCRFLTQRSPLVRTFLRRHRSFFAAATIVGICETASMFSRFRVVQ